MSSAGGEPNVQGELNVQSGGTLNVSGGTLTVKDGRELKVSLGTLNVSEGTLIVSWTPVSTRVL